MSPNRTLPQSTIAARWDALLAWRPERHSLAVRLLVAAGLAVLAVWLRMTLAPAESGGRFISIALATVLAALYGGFIVGLFCTLLGMVLVNFFMFEPYLQLAYAHPQEAFWLNTWHLITQLVVLGSIWLMQQQHLRLHAANARAQQSQQRFIDTFEHAPAGISHVDRQGRLLQVNRTFCDMLGYSAEELMAMRFQDITHPDDVAPDELHVRRALEGQCQRYTLEKRYIHKDGHIVWAQLTVALLRREANAPDFFIAVAQDISRLKASEEALRTSERLMRQAQVVAGFTSWEANLQSDEFRSLSGNFERIGLAGERFSGRELQLLTHPKDRERMAQEWRDAVKGVRGYSATYRAVVKEQDRWFSVRAEFERDAAGRALRAFGVTQDVTDRRRAELEVRRLNVSLEQRIQERTRDLKAAYDELESYSYAVAHDLRSPLRIINGFALALLEEEGQLKPESVQHLRRIMSASIKMGQLIDGLLQLAQIGRGDVQREPVDLSALATRLLEELQQESPQRRVQWTVQADLKTLADPPLMEALLQNLLHNAWKYTANTPQAEIHFFAHDSQSGTRYCVRDNGAGFDMAQAHKLYQPFHRLHKSHEFTGLGVGLATAQRIVLRHGGDLHATAAVGHGATFCFNLAREEAQDSYPSG